MSFIRPEVRAAWALGARVCRECMADLTVYNYEPIRFAEQIGTENPDTVVAPRYVGVACDTCFSAELRRERETDAEAR